MSSKYFVGSFQSYYGDYGPKEYVFKTNNSVEVDTEISNFHRIDTGYKYSSIFKVLKVYDSHREYISKNVTGLLEDAIAEVKIVKSSSSNTMLPTIPDARWSVEKKGSGYSAEASITADFPLSTTNQKKERGNNTMDFMKSLNFEFGKVNSRDAMYSVKGLAIADKNNHYKSFSDGEITDVTGMTIEVPLFKMPVAMSQVAVGDVIYHNKDLVLVKEVLDDGLTVVFVSSAIETKILPVKNLFGFNFYTKVMNPFEGAFGSMTSDNPMGNLLPLMLMSDSKGESKDMAMMMMMMSIGGSNQSFNPMMLMALMGDKGSDSMLPMLIMMQSMQPNSLMCSTPVKPSSEIGCGHNCTCDRVASNENV